MKKKCKPKIGSMILALRNELGLSQGDLAFMIGIHQTTLCLIELGQCAPRQTTLDKIAKALSVSTDVFNGLEQPILAMSANDMIRIGALLMKQGKQRKRIENEQ